MGWGRGLKMTLPIYAFQCISLFHVRKDLESFTHAPAHGNTFFSFSLISEGFPCCDVQAKGETEINNKLFEHKGDTFVPDI